MNKERERQRERERERERERRATSTLLLKRVNYVKFNLQCNLYTIYIASFITKRNVHCSEIHIFSMIMSHSFSST